MSRRSTAIGWSLPGLLLVPWLVLAGEPDAKPLRLALATSSTPLAASIRRDDELRAERHRLGAANGRRPSRLDQQDPSLGERALVSVLDGADMGTEAGTDELASGGRFQFERRGSAGRDISQGYRDMCARVSSKVWDEPNGRRMKFDIAGKPGVALVIPLR